MYGCRTSQVGELTVEFLAVRIYKEKGPEASLLLLYSLEIIRGVQVGIIDSVLIFWNAVFYMISLPVDGGLRSARWGLILRESGKAILTARVRYWTPSHVDKEDLRCRAVSITAATPHCWMQRRDDFPRTPPLVASSFTEPHSLVMIAVCTGILFYNSRVVPFWRQKCCWDRTCIWWLPSWHCLSSLIFVIP